MSSYVYLILVAVITITRYYTLLYSYIGKSLHYYHHFVYFQYHGKVITTGL